MVNVFLIIYPVSKACYFKLATYIYIFSWNVLMYPIWVKLFDVVLILRVNNILNICNITWILGFHLWQCYLGKVRDLDFYFILIGAFLKCPLLCYFGVFPKNIATTVYFINKMYNLLFIYLCIKALGKNYNNSKFSKLNFLCTNCITSWSITFIDEVFFKKRSANNLSVGEIPLLCIKVEAGLSTVVDSSSYSIFPVLHTSLIWIFFLCFLFSCF